jgi:hypothetical protein
MVKVLERIAVAWQKMCDHDGLPVNSKFVVFSDDNPFMGEYNEAMKDYVEMMRYASTR